MPVTDVYDRRETTTLYVNRDKRQRRDIFTPEGIFNNSDGLVESVRERGVLSPLLITREGQIIFGERRWEAAKLAQQSDVPVRYIEDVPLEELRIIELEENIRRKDLYWRDKVVAIAQLHEAYHELNGEKWGQTHTAQVLQLDTGEISRVLRVYEDLDNPKIAHATNYRQAYNTLYRQDERAAADLVEELASVAFSAVAGHVATSGPSGSPVAGVGEAGYSTTGEAGLGPDAPTSPATIESAPIGPPPDPIQVLSFLEWAPAYDGPRFNLIHCDFPYGVEQSAQVKGTEETPYADSRALYETLIECLCTNLDRVMSASGHLVFWLAADFSIHLRTRQMFARAAPSLLFWDRPLIWHKTDGASVIPDPSRLPRYAYETAIVAAREDRKIIRATTNIYGAPTDRKWHPSTKPEPVLRHFFSMFVDPHTRLLDPTCGSGSALRAAESLGAGHVLGLEVDELHAQNALTAMRQFRTLRAIAASESRRAS